MEIEHLYEFVVVAKMESFSRAAEELCMSQSSLSKHILALERDLGVTLLERRPRSVVLTPVGAQIMPMAAQAYELQNKIRVISDRQSSREKSVLCIASIPVMAQYNITGMLAKFQRQNPEVTLDVQEREQQDLQAMLEKDECELAFCRKGLEPEENLEYMEVCRDNLVAVVSKQHPLAQRETLELTDLKNEQLLFLDQQTGFQHLYFNLCRSAGFVPNIAYTGHRPENIVSLAAQEMGIALLMRRHTDFAPHPDVAVLDVTPRVESWVCLVRRKDRALTALARSFWEFVKETYSLSGNR